MHLLASERKSFGEWIYTISHEQTQERPSWVEDYLAPPAMAIIQEISDLEQQISTLSVRAEIFYPLLPLLYGTGTELEDAVELFSRPMKKG